jgi:hypothetical protein
LPNKKAYEPPFKELKRNFIAGKLLPGTLVMWHYSVQKLIYKNENQEYTIIATTFVPVASSYNSNACHFGPDAAA